MMLSLDLFLVFLGRLKPLRSSQKSLILVRATIVTTLIMELGATTPRVQSPRYSSRAV
ncbi:unnamed protein product [Brassica oleracea]